MFIHALRLMPSCCLAVAFLSLVVLLHSDTPPRLSQTSLHVVLSNGSSTAFSVWPRCRVCPEHSLRWDTLEVGYFQTL